MKLLVTGAAGCLGRAVLARALAAGHQVRAVDLRRPETPVPGPEWVACDLAATDVHGLLPLASGCDAVVHLAALVHRPEIRDSTHYREINTELTARLIDAALSAGVPRGRFAFSSTVGAIH